MSIFTAMQVGNNLEHFAPFEFTFEPLTLSPSLGRDISLYVELSEKCEGIHPTWPMLLFMGNGAEELFLRRAGTSDRWAAFTAEVGRRFPTITAKTAAATAEVVGLAVGGRRGAASIWRPSGPEVLLGLTLLNNLPDGVTLTADQPLPGSHARNGGVHRCDFQYVCDVTNRADLRIEVLGFLDRFGLPRTAEGVAYAKRQGNRAKIYKDAGLEPPIIIYADEVCDPQLRTASVRRVLAALEALRGGCTG